MNGIQVATLPLEIELAILERLLGGIETALDDLGATHVWVELHGSSFVIMAEMPTTQQAPRSARVRARMVRDLQSRRRQRS